MNQVAAHSVRADPPSSRPIGCSSSSFSMLSLPSLGSNCLSFPLSGGPGPATSRFHVRHTYCSRRSNEVGIIKIRLIKFSSVLTRNFNDSSLRKSFWKLLKLYKLHFIKILFQPYPYGLGNIRLPQLSIVHNPLTYRREGGGGNWPIGPPLFQKQISKKKLLSDENSKK